ncbi:MAG: hypothetical protein E7273_10020 [Pseudobutyrivibrio ruminis]|nr:hypothetical protein [Pseudobutyrivibrio ruminis]
MDAYIASVPIHLLYAMHMIKQKGIRDCDLYYVPTSNNADELLRAVKETGIFHDVIMLPNINIEYPITIAQCIKIAINRFGARKELKKKYYDTVYYNTDGWLLNSIIFSSLNNKCAKNIFVENGINPYLTPYDSKEWYLRLFINCQFMTCMDGRFIDERYVFEPSLISVAQSGEIHKINKLNRSDNEVKEHINQIFGYDEKLDSFKDKKIIIMEQGPRKEPIDMIGLWKKVSNYIDKESAIVKSHPRQKESALRELGFDLYERYTIPWEVLTFNQDMSEKTLFCIFSTSCVNPKVMFDEEPRIVLLYKLIGIDYSFFGRGMINYVEGVRDLYRDKSKFFIPDSWDELEDYSKKYNLSKK